jgi:hypothetical protein
MRLISKYQPREMLAGPRLPKESPHLPADAGLNNNVSALCHPFFSYPCLIQKNPQNTRVLNIDIALCWLLQSKQS